MILVGKQARACRTAGTAAGLLNLFWAVCPFGVSFGLRNGGNCGGAEASSSRAARSSARRVPDARDVNFVRSDRAENQITQSWSDDDANIWRV
jgi:hypothetical protein